MDNAETEIAENFVDKRIGGENSTSIKGLKKKRAVKDGKETGRSLWLYCGQSRARSSFFHVIFAGFRVYSACMQIDTKKMETNWTSCAFYDIIINGLLDTYVV